METSECLSDLQEGSTNLAEMCSCLRVKCARFLRHWLKTLVISTWKVTNS